MKKKNFLVSLMFFLPTLLPAQSMLQQLEGEWTMTAANNGTEIAPGIYSSGTDVINFTAKADGDMLSCHTDCLYKSVTSETYPGDWYMKVEENGEGQHRIGWWLRMDIPVSSQEFNEPKSSYLENGFWYWAHDNYQGHHYIFLLTENSDASVMVPTMFWSSWSSQDATEYTLTSTEYNSRKVYAVVGANMPLTLTLGLIEIWSNPKMRHVSNTAIRTVTSNDGNDGPCYDLQGRQLKEQPQKGLYIRNGRKYIQQ